MFSASGILIVVCNKAFCEAWNLFLKKKQQPNNLKQLLHLARKAGVVNYARCFASLLVNYCTFDLETADPKTKLLICKSLIFFIYRL